MKRHSRLLAILGSLFLLVAAGCGADAPPPGDPAARQKPAPDAARARSPGKLSAPIFLEYEVLGRPLVGLPVAINIRIRAPQNVGPVSVRYSLNDASALVFQEGQVERLLISDPAEDELQQVAVVPQREGRLYLNVSAEVETDGGTMIKSMAIPIQVGSAPARPELNGRLREGPDGESVIAMPAVEN